MSVLESLLLVMNCILGVASVTALFMNISNKIKAKRNQDLQKLQASADLTNEALKNILRQQITDIYRRSKNAGFIYSKDEENLCHLVQIYTDLGGNSYVATIYQEMLDMEVRLEGN